MSSVPSLSGRRLLILEDEALVAMCVKMMLSELGADVVATAGSISRGLALLADGALEIDAAVLDVNMGAEPSYPIADLLISRNVPFVFATGYRAASIPARFGHISTVSKPFDESLLEAKLLTAISEGAAKALG